MRYIKITEKNYEEILAKIKSMSDNYLFLEKSYRLKDNKILKDFTLPFFRMDKKLGKLVPRCIIFIDACEHHFRKSFMSMSYFPTVTYYPEDFQKNENLYVDKVNYELYEKYKSLIMLSTGSFSSVVLSYGDKIKFTPFGFSVIIAEKFFKKEFKNRSYKFSYVKYRKVSYGEKQIIIAKRIRDKEEYNDWEV